MRDLADELLQAKVKSRLFGGDRAPRLGRLILIDRLGAGASGTVFAAYDPRLERRVALKVFHGSSPRILDEARALAKLSHPNVIAIHDADETDGAIYLVMELATGVPLRAWLETPRAWREVVRVMRDVAAGLAAAHRAQIVHRDVKPDNVLLDADGRARLADFGLVGAATGGTPSYMAPEVVAGEPASAASDQFAFGVMLHEALHGERPRDATTVGKRPVPAWVASIARRALAADPAKRFASLDAIAVELGRDRRRTRAIAVGVIGALVIGGGLGAFAMRGSRTGPDCSGDARRDAAWNPATSARVKTALAGAPWADATVASLDQDAARWATSYRAVCEATRVRGEQSDRLLEVRMACLSRTLSRFSALVDVLSPPLDAAGKAEAASAVAELREPATCTTLVEDAEPADPSLDRAWAQFALGHYQAARTAITGDSAASLALGGAVEARIGDPARARGVLDRALVAAAAAHLAELEYDVWLRLERNELFSGSPAHVLEWEPFARAAATRAGRDGGELDGVVGEARRKANDPAGARAAIAHAFVSSDPIAPAARAIIELNLAVIELESDQPERARPLLDHGLATAQAALGDGHPTLALFLDKQARLAALTGHRDVALALHDRSLALRRAAFGPTDRSIATGLYERAITLREAGRLVEAKADLEAARTIRVVVFGATSPRLGEIDLALAGVAADGGHADDATALRARATTENPVTSMPR